LLVFTVLTVVTVLGRQALEADADHVQTLCNPALLLVTVVTVLTVVTVVTVVTVLTVVTVVTALIVLTAMIVLGRQALEADADHVQTLCNLALLLETTLDSDAPSTAVEVPFSPQS
jgi:ABC-type transport system involved in cytochrome bd biosynthesis fused ATPase/permease subunit